MIRQRFFIYEFRGNISYFSLNLSSNRTNIVSECH